MAKIRYSPAAIKDLEQIGDYISQMLKNPMAALNTVNQIQDSVDRLARFPLAGAPLSSVEHTHHRFLVCGSYLVFYRTESDIVSVDRILYGKRDYMAILFRSVLQGNAEQEE